MARSNEVRRSATSSRKPKSWMALAGVIALVVLAGAGAVFLLPPGRKTPGAAGDIGGPFTLTEGDGRQVTDRDFRGRYLLVYFGYTFCPDVCPTTLSAVASAMTKLGDQAGRVQPLFVTVDPRRDTPAVVGQYTSSFPPVIGLTGTPEEIAQVAHAYRVYYAPQKTGAGSDDYTVDHSSVLYLMGPDGRFVAPIPADADAATIAADVSAHLSKAGVPG